MSTLRALILTSSMLCASSVSMANITDGRFLPYGDNYLIWQYTEHKKYSANAGNRDEESAEAAYGFEYVLMDFQRSAERNPRLQRAASKAERLSDAQILAIIEWDGESALKDVVSLGLDVSDMKDIQDYLKHKLLHEFKDTDKTYFSFSYNGQFDFYAGTRDSGPVINRKSNTSFNVVHHQLTKTGHGINYWRIGNWELGFGNTGLMVKWLRLMRPMATVI